MADFPGSENFFLIGYITTFVTGLPLNIIALCTLIKKCRKNLLPVDILLINLTISDLLLLAFLPFRMVEAASDMKWLLPYFICSLSFFLLFSSIYITSLFLMAISVERYLAIAFPIKYKLLQKRIYFVVASVFFWCLATVHCSIVYIVEHVVPMNVMETNTTVCYGAFSPPQLAILLPVRLEIFLLLFCVPFVITVFCYVNFIKIIMSQARIQRRRKLRAICLVVATLINFIICFLPYNVSHVVGFIEGDSPKWRVYTVLLSSFNASVDPIIFYFSTPSFKKAFLEGLFNMMKKLHFESQCYKYCSAYCICNTENEETNVTF
ncbi:free fatty acid receptor 3-like [Pseudophryne corroboree]|uniref:free fatty acid receptor 3-like n=1 Tax=Pseudophryne corroboree TaxID=495146 RepID=UPI0030821AC9